MRIRSPLLCPRCRDESASVPLPGEGVMSVVCSTGSHTFPVVQGVLDLREETAPTCWADARTCSEKLLVDSMSRRYQESTLDSLVSEYVDTLRLPERLLSATRDYMWNAHLREAWGVRYMEHCAFRYGASVLSGGVVLEAGCGSGGSIPHLAHLFNRVVGTDVDLPAILIAKKRCEQLGVSDRVQLVASALEQPIFPVGSFEAIKCTDVLEHVQDPVRSCSLLAKALRPGGGLFVLTPNKWSTWSPEPHVRLWGVQFLPPRWADAYVKWRIGIPYRNVANLIGYRGLMTMLQQTGLAVVFIPIEDKHLNPRSVRGIKIKSLFSRGPLAWLSRAARLSQPTLEALCLAGPANDEREPAQ